MKTFDEFTRKFFVPDDSVPVIEDDTSDDSEFVIPECWKPKTFFQSIFLNYALDNTNGDYTDELRTALSNELEDFNNQHTITKTEIVLDENLNFTVTVGESNTTAESEPFRLANDSGLSLNIAIDGENLPRRVSELYTGMTANSHISGDTGRVSLSNVNANTFTDGAHHVVLSTTTTSPDLEPKTYKELVFGGGKTGPIVENKMLPKTPEELAFALLTGAPLEFSEEVGGADLGDLTEHENS